MKNQNKQQKENKEQQETKKSGDSKFINANEHRANDPHADRSAKTSRKGAGQQQGSSGSPINS
ncbi:MAG: hypothetical protein H0U44_00805 [Flavisolibacter sp.]|jgi:hypothetical protein|nr:hypothetical protein [Flavisolibacter sp.]